MSRTLAAVLATVTAVLAAASAALPVGVTDPAGMTLPGCSPLPPRFCADAAYFLADSSYVLEVYFRVCNDGLQFIKYADGYRASADLSVVLRDGKDRQTAGDTYRIKLFSATYDGTVSIDSCRTEVVAFKARQGDYRMALGLYDRDSRAKSVAEASLDIPAMLPLPSLSDVEFLEPAAGDYEGPRQGYGPKVRRVYSGGHDSVTFYYEVYGASADSLGVTEQVTSSAGVKLWEASRRFGGGAVVTHLEKLAGDLLPSGRYTLKLSLKDAGGREVATRSKEFEVRSEAFYTSRNLEEAVAILTYVATGSEISAFEKASESERKKMWEDFWREKDPTPGTPRNEFFDEHMRRFRYANDHFGVPLTPGWKSDRGRIYIIYGEPDEIESYPFEMGRKPTEIWTYYDKGRRFVFVDETGFGDYVLVGS